VHSRSGLFVTAMAALLMLAMGTAAIAAQSSPAPIVVTAVQGDVQVTSDGAERPATLGSTIRTPATIHTGHDGFVELRQGATTAAIASDTRVDLPAVTAPDGLIEHIRQPAGNVLYDVAKRTGRKLRIETPYLVAVVKGTRFNVAAQDEDSTISLLEGRLEIWTPDDSDVVQINAGEIATRSRGDTSIRVLGMATGESIRAHNPRRSTQPASQEPARASARHENAPAAVHAEETVGTRTTTTAADAAISDTTVVKAPADDTLTAVTTDTRIDSGVSTDIGGELGTDTRALPTELSVDTTAPAVVDAVVAPLPAVIDEATASLPAIAEPMPAIVEDIVTPVPTVVVDVVEPVPAVVEDVVDPVPTVIKDVVEPAPTVVEDVVEPVPAVIEDVTAAIPDITEEVIAPVKTVTEETVVPVVRELLPR